MRAKYSYCTEKIFYKKREIMDTNKLNQMIRIAKMHYEMNYTQLEIASREG